MRRDACAWCDGPIGGDQRTDAECCGKRCRQARWRFGRGIRRAPRNLVDATRPMRFAYADPPYPGKAHYYHCDEVDHVALIRGLINLYPDGWALSTSSEALGDLLPLCPPWPRTRVGSWHRPVRPGRSRRPLIAWEPLIVVGGRPLDCTRVQTVRDAVEARGRFRAHPGALIGMKPPQFSEWMFQMLGARPGDTLVDLFPGSGAVSRAWDLYVAPAAPASGDASRPQASSRSATT